ncbi:MAG TPA: 1-acyl-sn-glycerol-3-phosphate acyltransferase [Burkholderiaceae bacterium]|jgi:1-acyl-sn-glycerol-3-phosphate acyltransferase
MTSHLLIPSELPRFSQRVAARLLAIFGWRVRFAPLPGPRGVIVVYPHTSNWDFIVGVVAKWAVGVPIRWLGKEALFAGTFGFCFGRLMRYLGGEPIERHASTGAIDRLAQRMRAEQSYWLALAPEGTRDYRPHWRSGFYHIALAAKVPLAIAYIDYPTRTIGVVDHVELTGDVGVDMAKIRAAYDGYRGLHPQLAAPIEFPPPAR